ncbi:hypothetical protein [uncultured Maritimibacter sp.]|jgi:Ca2+-binding RTX toxin-like protein|uniref:calcium-binding protein n=1 Tax=uncultured Maritimibacter sp. TaxID=991866 RepID=UPI00260D1533|nr:hypothetical protein [uncultured Maritimibacter sp.]
MFVGDMLFYSFIALFFMAQSGLFDFGTLFGFGSGADAVADTVQGNPQGMGPMDPSDALDDTSDLAPLGDYVAADYSAVRLGTTGADSVVASSADTALAYFMWAGGDTLIATSGDDYADGGDGDDVLTLRDGDDIAHGGAGDDVIRGGEGDDRLYGEDGDDIIEGHGDDDTIFGGLGNDRIEGGYGDDNIFGGAGDDVLSGDSFSAAVIGRGADTLDGGEGNDRLWLGDGDVGTGGAGEDTFDIYEVTDPDRDAARITDFDKATDSLQVHYIPDTDPGTGDALPPTISVNWDGDNENMRIEVNGRLVATLDGEHDITEDDVELIAQE